jgi:hypothetical protein
LGRTTPCADCPWLKKSAPGYLGADEPIHFYRASVVREVPMPCHMTIDYDEPDWQETQLPDADLCAGNLIYLRNFLKRPRRPELQEPYDAVKPSPHVFSGPEEFMAHHGAGGNPQDMALKASWPFAEEDE